MITEKEIQAVELSPTACDFYQIWNELLDTATKLSERWDPISTNESDPGIVLLKVLTAVADKLNYTIDKNILEAFMPSATQEESMRKLCDMLGYNMKYYQSATTTIQISYIGDRELTDNDIITIPQFTSIKNIDEEVNYVTLESVTLSKDAPMATVTAIEGSIQTVETENENNKITISLFDDNNRFYLPEAQVAENGIFISDVANKFNEDTLWKKVENLNTQVLGTKCYKFGFDSRLSLPYIQFPDDVNAIIDDGIYIKYIRTSGINGNVSARTLTNIEIASSESENNTEVAVTAEDLSVTNITIANNGRNKETINDAYNSYKKTIGTFDTLVTCRDYMNKIYQLTVSQTDTTPLVSNVIVSDIRDDINKAVELCSFSEEGTTYTDIAKQQNGSNLIEHFDLILYPFYPYNNLNTIADYKNSFKYSTVNRLEILAGIDDNKTISHNIRMPDTTDLACIKVYLKLKAKITTTKKVNSVEEAYILAAVKAAIFSEFNMRKLDFGEEIPYDRILNCIQNADTRIKNVSLDEPILDVRFLTCDGEERNIYDAAGQAIYNKLALNNILAGKIPLFNYNTDFKPDFSEKAPQQSGVTQFVENISELSGTYEPPISACPITLHKNEVIRFRAPNFKTTLTYPGYVNYYLHLTNTEDVIENGTDYELKNGEYLLINYTQNDSTNNESSADVVVNKVYTSAKHTIIRPSGFSTGLHDSLNTSLVESKKRDGNWTFDGYNPEFLRTLGTSEQIEIRDKVEVTLDDNVCYLYWVRHDDAENTENDTVEFKFNDDNTYELKDGEYLFYTDKNKIDMAFYGKGTVIQRDVNTPALIKHVANEISSTEDILNYGLAASMNWVRVDLSANNASILIKEYKYITLSADDTLKEIAFEDNSITNLSSTWKPVKSAKYIFSKNTEAADGEPLPSIEVSSIKWEACSVLEFNIGPSTPQILYENDKIYVKTKGSSAPIPYSGTADGLCLKANYLYQTSINPLKIISPTNTSNFNFKIKAMQLEPPKVNNSMVLPLNNFGDNWTLVKMTQDYNKFTLQTYIPDGNFGLVMVYCTDTTERSNVYLTSTASEPLVIYNYPNSESEAWWDGNKDSNNYYLRSGINIIKLTSSGALTFTHINDTDSTVIISNLDLVYTDNAGINPRLDYYDDDNNKNTEDAMKKLLAQINEQDPNHTFYYNAFVENSTAIDINMLETNEDSENYETLASPRTWYDPNNINNKFVISEIDADYLGTGITIAKTSKL